MAGVLAGKKTLIEQVRKLHGVLGGVVDPHAAYLLNRGLKTLALPVHDLAYLARQNVKEFIALEPTLRALQENLAENVARS